jgi:hypothetical protein
MHCIGDHMDYTQLTRCVQASMSANAPSSTSG